MEASTFYLSRPYPVFRVTVHNDRLETDGYWWRTAQVGEAFIRVVDLRGSWVGTKLRRLPLYLHNEEEEGLYRAAGDPMLCVRADQLQGARSLECILLDHAEIAIS